MSQTHKTIISDTSCFILLSKIGEFDLLEKVYCEIITTSTIAEEFGETLPQWVKIQDVTDTLRLQILEMQIERRIQRNRFGIGNTRKRFDS